MMRDHLGTLANPKHRETGLKHFANPAVFLVQKGVRVAIKGVVHPAIDHGAGQIIGDIANHIARERFADINVKPVLRQIGGDTVIAGLMPMTHQNNTLFHTPLRQRNSHCVALKDHLCQRL